MRTTLIALLALVSLIACADAEANLPVNVPVPGADYLAADIPPCTPIEGFDVEPCGEAPLVSNGVLSDAITGSDGPFSIEQYMEGFRDNLGYGGRAHLVVRATYLPDTMRCVAREAREHPWRSPPYKTNSRVAYEGAWFTSCYADLRVNSYIVGTGPPKLTVQVMQQRHVRVPPGYAPRLMELRRDADRALIRGGYIPGLIRVSGSGIAGREGIMFLAPSNDFSREVLSVVSTWAMEERDDGTVIAVHPNRYSWSFEDDYESKHRSKVEIPLAEFTQEAQRVQAERLTANGGRIGAATTLPKFIIDANKLNAFHVQAGNTTHQDGPPVPPPPPCGLVVADQTATPRLMTDCMALLEAKDTLRGTGTLNWSTATAIANWDGISTDAPAGGAGAASGQSNATPTQVTKVELANKGLTGSVPEALRDVGMTTLKLAGNTLTGCIPPDLRDVGTNDLSRLNLVYCSPGEPVLAVGAVGQVSVALSWASVPDATKYRVEYVKDVAGEVYAVASDTITGTSYTVSALGCGTPYAFRVSAFGGGSNVNEVWSTPSHEATTTTAECVPVFSQDAYAFQVAEDAGSYAVVGTVTATAPYADAVTYRNVGGNSEGKFGIDLNAGFVVVRSRLDYETTSAYALIVEASDGEGGTANVVVTVTVTDVAE